MISFNFLGGGALTFILILIAIFILYIIYRILLVPLLAIFGINRESTTKLSERTMSSWLDAWTKERSEGDREEKERAQEGEVEFLTEKAEQTNQDAGRLLTEGQSSQNFGAEKVNALRGLLEQQEQLVIQEGALFKDLEREYQEDRNTAGKIRDDLKEVFSTQRIIEQRALDTTRKIESYGQTDPDYSSIAAICEEIKAFERQVEDLQARDVQLARQVQEITTTRRTLCTNIKKILDSSKNAAKKEPILPQLPFLLENQVKIEQTTQQILALNREAQGFVADHLALIKPLQNISSKIIPLLEQQQAFIKSSLVKLTDLASRGAVPIKLAA